jgi:hypothetical protein
MLMPAPSEASRPTAKAVQLFRVANAAANTAVRMTSAPGNLSHPDGGSRECGRRISCCTTRADGDDGRFPLRTWRRKGYGSRIVLAHRLSNVVIGTYVFLFQRNRQRRNFAFGKVFKILWHLLSIPHSRNSGNKSFTTKLLTLSGYIERQLNEFSDRNGWRSL